MRLLHWWVAVLPIAIMASPAVTGTQALPTQGRAAGFTIESNAEPTLFSGLRNAECEAAPNEAHCDTYKVVVRNEGSERTGIAEVGETETCEAGTWDESPTDGPTEFKYEWLRGPLSLNEPKVLGTAQSYTIQASDSGFALTCRVIAVNSFGATAASTAAIRVAPLEEQTQGSTRGLPTLSVELGELQAPQLHPVEKPTAGETKVGEAVECAAGSWKGEGAVNGWENRLRYRLLLNGVPVKKAFAEKPAFTVPAGAEGKAVQCEVAAILHGGGVDLGKSLVLADSANRLVVEPEPVGGSAPRLPGAKGGELTLADAPAISGVTVTLHDILPAGVTAVGVTGTAFHSEIATGGGNEPEQPLRCELAALSCSLPLPMQPGWGIEMTIPVTVQHATGAIAANTADVSGGTTPARSTAEEPIGKVMPTPIGEGEPPFAITAFSLQPFGSAGLPDLQAGGHPYAVTATFQLPTIPPKGEAPETANVRDVRVTLPAGLIGNPLVSAQCAYSDVAEESCPPDSQVGVFTFTRQVSNIRGTEELPIYNLTPQAGYPAEFGGIYLHRIVTMFANVLRAPVDQGGYVVQVTVPGIPLVTPVTSGTFTFFGNPAQRTGNGTGQPFLTSPMACGVAPRARIEADAWQAPGNYKTLEGPLYSAGGALAGCSLLQFNPTIAMEPESRQADTPSGYTFRLRVPQSSGAAPTLATPELKDTIVTLPEGVVVSPSAAGGLQACAPSQIGVDAEGVNGDGHEDGQLHPTPGHCPLTSKIATATVTTPLLEQPLEGSVYLGAPECSPCTSADAQSGKMLKLYIEARGSGVVVKLAGSVSADPATGRLEATFKNSPQLPFSDLKLNFKSGPRAPLANPQTCGAFTTTSDLKPWSAPETPDANPSSRFEIGSGPGGSACASSEAQEPNKPSFEAGTTTPIAANFSPFVMHLRRADATQRLRALNLTLPPGLSGRLTGIPYCPDAALAAAAGGSGAEEKASPSCPAASEVGTVTVGAGPGAQPYYVQGHAYLAGPYNAAPLSLVIVTPAVAGPYDLGTVVVRAALYVNPETAQITVRSDEIPHILAGIPLDIRSVAVEINRSEFTLNPTNCEEMAVSGEAISLAGRAASLTNRFEVGACKGLPFKPKLALRVFGKTRRNTKPRFRAVLQAEPGEANIRRAQVNLPHSEFLEQNHIKTICTRVQFAQGNGNGSACPKGSVYGHARAFTPLLDKPLEGPVFLRANGGERKLPDLVAALNGQVNIALWGKVDSGKNRGLRNTFEVVPDAPVSKFILEMRGGKRGLLVNSENLCSKKAKTTAIVRLVAQNGKVEHFKPKVRNDCGKRRKTHRGHRR